MHNVSRPLSLALQEMVPSRWPLGVLGHFSSLSMSMRRSELLLLLLVEGCFLGQTAAAGRMSSITFLNMCVSSLDILCDMALI